MAKDNSNDNVIINGIVLAGLVTVSNKIQKVIESTLHDDLLKHQMFVQRLIGTETENIKIFLNLLERTAIKHVANDTEINTLKTSLRGVMRPLKDSGIGNMRDIAEYESKFSASLFSRYFDIEVKSLSAPVLEKALKNNNMAINYLKDGVNGQKKSLATAYTQFAQRKADDITQIIKDGRSLKQVDKDIIAKIQERIVGLSSTQAASLSQTAINFTTGLARSETIQSNPEMPDKVLWVADLEVNEHCEDCEDLDGEIYTLDDIEEPPLHWGCACHLEPVSGD